MRKFLLALCLGAFVFCASAANYLHIKTSTGWEVLDLDKVDRLTFSNGKMNAQDEKGVTVGTYSQASLEQIYVNDLAVSWRLRRGWRYSHLFTVSVYNALASRNVLFRFVSYSKTDGIQQRESLMKAVIPSISYTFSF